MAGVGQIEAMTSAIASEDSPKGWRRIPQINEVAQNSKASLDWLGMYAEALAEKPDGMFPNELRAWHAENRTSDEEVAQRNDEREFARGMQLSTGMFTQWGLITAKVEYPDRIYPNSAFRLLEEPCVRLTKKGKALAAKPLSRQRAYFNARFAWTILARAFAVLRGPLAVASFLLTILKFGTQWSNVQSAMGALGGGAVALFWAITHQPHRGA
jgi:hypothetical protein